MWQAVSNKKNLIRVANITIIAIYIHYVCAQCSSHNTTYNVRLQAMAYLAIVHRVHIMVFTIYMYVYH